VRVTNSVHFVPIQTHLSHLRKIFLFQAALGKSWRECKIEVISLSNLLTCLLTCLNIYLYIFCLGFELGFKARSGRQAALHSLNVPLPGGREGPVESRIRLLPQIIW